MRIIKIMWTMFVKNNIALNRVDRGKYLFDNIRVPDSRGGKWIFS